MKEEVICLCCYEYFAKSPRHKNQNYCKKLKCQRTQKAEWQRKKLLTDPEYKSGQKLSNKKWQETDPDYWKKYRSKNVEKTERNRLLQKLRNRKKGHTTLKIAKMDPSKSSPYPRKHKICGPYWLVPIIAKMDPLKVNIVIDSNSYN